MPALHPLATASLLALLLVSHGAGRASREARPKCKPPNIVLILLDDSGWTDFGCYGSRIDTPNIDRIAAQGIRFTDCHSPAPNCSPSRAGLLTGRTPSRVGMYSYRPPGHSMHLRSEEVTLAEILKARGYHTGHFGKWHLSTLLDESQPSPAEQGFDHSLGTDNNASPSHRDPTNFVQNGTEVGPMRGYSCQIVVNETIGWLDRIHEEENAQAESTPFFACVWYHEPHAPIASPDDLVRKYQQRYPELSKRDAIYFANIENVDRATGRLLAHLERLGVDDNTLVFLTSDNGGLRSHSMQGLRGKKSHLWEGGHRVAGMFRWPNRIEAGGESDVPISGVDFLPTVCELTGSSLPDCTLDGVSLAGLLTGEATALERTKPLYWFFYRMNPALAVRDGRWVLLADTNDAKRKKTHGLAAADMPFIKQSRPERFLLYDLHTELDQRTDVAARHPEVFAAMKAKAIALHREVMREGHEWQDLPDGRGKGRVWDSYK